MSDNTTIIYKRDYSTEGWGYILEDLELPSDTDEIIVKEISYVTESQRKEKRDKDNANSNRT